MTRPPADDEATTPLRTGRLTSTSPSRDVLFVTTGVEAESAGLLRAAALARMFGGEMFVVCAAPRRTRHNMLFPQWNSGESLAVSSTRADLRDRLRALCDDVFATAPVPDERVLVREGDVVSVAVAEAEALGAAIVVLGACGDGATATDVACQTGLPVLVGRRARTGAIVAATDLTDGRFPVLRQASRLAEQMDERATIVHNVQRGGALALSPVGLDSAFALVSQGELVREYERRLRAVVRSLGVAAEAVVLSRSQAIDAILEVARRGDADLLVVGTRARSWFDRLLSTSVAELAVDRTDRSVLVLPLLWDAEDGPFGAPTTWSG